MEQGLAAVVADVGSRYGNGEGSSVKHYYAGAGTKKKKKCKSKGK